MDKTDWTSPEQAAALQQKWEDELVRRFQAGFPLTVADRIEARRLVGQRAQATGKTA